MDEYKAAPEKVPNSEMVMPDSITFKEGVSIHSLFHRIREIYETDINETPCYLDMLRTEFNAAILEQDANEAGESQFEYHSSFVECGIPEIIVDYLGKEEAIGQNQNLAFDLIIKASLYHKDQFFYDIMEAGALDVLLHLSDNRLPIDRMDGLIQVFMYIIAKDGRYEEDITTHCPLDRIWKRYLDTGISADQEKLYSRFIASVCKYPVRTRELAILHLSGIMTFLSRNKLNRTSIAIIISRINRQFSSSEYEEWQEMVRVPHERPDSSETMSFVELLLNVVYEANETDLDDPDGLICSITCLIGTIFEKPVECFLNVPKLMMLAFNNNTVLRHSGLVLLENLMEAMPHVIPEIVSDEFMGHLMHAINCCDATTRREATACACLLAMHGPYELQSGLIQADLVPIMCDVMECNTEKFMKKLMISGLLALFETFEREQGFDAACEYFSECGVSDAVEDALADELECEQLLLLKQKFDRE